MARLLLRKNNPANPPSELFYRDGIAALLLRGTAEDITSTNNIQKPVDYFLAGDRRDYRGGHAPEFALKAIFNE